MLATANPIPNIKSPNFTQIDINQYYGTTKKLNLVQMRFEGKRWLDIVEEEMLPVTEGFVVGLCLHALHLRFRTSI